MLKVTSSEESAVGDALLIMSDCGNVITLLLIGAAWQTCRVYVSVFDCFLHHVLWESGCVYKLFARVLFM